MSINTYKYTDKIKLSPHFSSNEFNCKCGRKHDTYINTELVNALENLMSLMNSHGIPVQHAYISSGYRCPAHDKAVGGTGYGNHTKAPFACDIRFVKADGKYVPAELVACFAQECKVFGGIGVINAEYIHLDIRTSHWWSDERRAGGTSASLAGNNFWAFYGINRATYFTSNTPTPSGNNEYKELQTILNSKGANLVVDGIVGTNTLNAVKKYSIENGDSGELTKWVQKHLCTLGYKVTVDGIAGKNTIAALNKWQSDNGINVGKFYGSDWDKFLK